MEEQTNTLELAFCSRPLRETTHAGRRPTGTGPSPTVICEQGLDMPCLSTSGHFYLSKDLTLDPKMEVVRVVVGLYINRRQVA